MSVKCGKCGKEGTEESLQRCSRCKSIWYCSVECQHSDWKAHKGICIDSQSSVTSNFPAGPDEPVQGVVIPCEGDRDTGLFQPVQLPPSHPIHNRGILSPISELVGVPIFVWRHLQKSPFEIPRTAALDNQITTYLMIEPESGFAPPQWQQCVGTVSVMRRDRKPLTPLAIEIIWMYFDNLLEEFSDGGRHPSHRMNPAGFQRYCRHYKEECVMNGRSEFNDLTLPL